MGWGKSRVARVTCVVVCVVTRIVTMGRARAAIDAPNGASAAAETPARTAKNAFSLAYAVRPWAPPNLVRIDSAFLVDKTQRTAVPTLTVGAKVFADLGLYFRGAMVANAPDGQPQRSGVCNPALFALYAPELAPKLRLPLFLAFAAPLGDGGGDAPDPHERAALGTGVYARQAMDNALFAPNYLTAAFGAGLSHVDRGLTLQVEATAFQLFRARGAAMDSERTRMNLTSGVNVGYAVTEFLNLNIEAHYQRWLSTPSAVQKDSALREQLTVGGGVRFTIAQDRMVLRPGIGYFRGIDAPMTRTAAHIIQIDLPIVM